LTVLTIRRTLHTRGYQALGRSSIEIQTDLDFAYAQRLRAMTPGFSLDTGQGRQSTQPVDLDKLNKTIDYLKAELATCGEEAAGFGVVSRIGFDR
jgi:hypothetical protein